MIFESCSLGSAEQNERARRFAALRDRALEVHEHEQGIEFVFLRDAPLAAEVGELAALEASCCALRTTIEVGPDSIRVQFRR